MKRLLPLLFCILILFVGCSSKDTNPVIESVDIDESDESTRQPLPFDVEKFKTTYEKELEAFKEEFQEKLEEKLAEDADEKAQIIFNDKKIIFENGQMSEAVVFLSVLNDMVGEQEEIGRFASDFIEDLVDDDRYSNEVIKGGLEIKISAKDKTAISIGIFDAVDKDD